MSKRGTTDTEPLLAVVADGFTTQTEPLLAVPAGGFSPQPLEAVIPTVSGTKPAARAYAPSNEADRSVFEAFARSRCLPLTRRASVPGQEYANAFTQTARESWNAALQHAAVTANA
jgi:hypothetical protein